MPEDFTVLERKVAAVLRNEGWQVIKARDNQVGYDLIATNSGQSVAVQVKDFLAPVRPRQLSKFFDYVESPAGQRFVYGVFVTSSYYSPQTRALYEEWASPRLRLAIIDGDQLRWEDAPTPPEPPDDGQPTLIGVFTCKGGVGKTTISAHLGGAMRLNGYRVALVDLDPQNNLKNLLGNGLPVIQRGRENLPLHVFSQTEWDTRANQNQYSAVICDCSPRFEANPVSLVKRFRYCIIPTTLNPLGINKNGLVIKETVRKIRSVNPGAFLFILINCHLEDTTVRANTLLEAYKKFFQDLVVGDDKFEIVDPEEACIRHSKDLFYWGEHLYGDGRPKLAFMPRGGRCKPKEDFLNLLAYLEARSTIARLRE